MRTMSSTSDLKPLTIWGKGGPNPPKVRIVAAELGIPYTVKDISFPDLKTPAFLAINPNGRMPAIQDPNTDLTLWESGAIIEYLVETYDTQHKISFAPGSKDAWLAKQWLFFQGKMHRCMFNLPADTANSIRPRPILRTGRLVYQVPFRTNPKRKGQVLCRDQARDRRAERAFEDAGEG
jgi:glutathione S-transferase